MSAPASACAWPGAAAALRTMGLACVGLAFDRAASRVGLAGVPEPGCSAACTDGEVVTFGVLMQLSYRTPSNQPCKGLLLQLLVCKQK